ncbi:hypothetical protein [Terrisporobacter hibernicus]|uniref:Uncharacterized protein n=1 Tax=Terrisporobacter hibernicus TaxID=2813371 RepID=A0AAX2ZJG9_9FIRM|nr:hypothetical protein [Terrisporobacter hibernicus]UEL49473.1 hypothetical protein JW646_08525 [Terrisporobacter hibernicus]
MANAVLDKFILQKTVGSSCRTKIFIDFHIVAFVHLNKLNIGTRGN